ncbi:hypothetical protein GCK72_020820 [Caenorhabditis remanei]|uniref:MATH domain-containing protein n=1 Tax=Caenorhabditis remanei TaxID=31234 RepID=A0A6A5GGI5_CAERE|nr:hypothetical protein GCK72_020820 [Caenorhabditis remanei]KAF1754260.1 hypothetical protein GCK72_020820 [Caenorhabditis remanei]
MTERSKYPINGICRFENVARLIENNNFPENSIGWMCGIEWYFSLRTKEINDITYIYAFLDSRVERSEVFNLRSFFSFESQEKIKNKKSEHCVFLYHDESPRGHYLKVDKLIDEENGWLSDGALSVEYGFCVLSIQDDDEIWKFNFYDSLFDCDRKQNMIRLEDKSWRFDDCLPLCTHKQVLAV